MSLTPEQARQVAGSLAGSLARQRDLGVHGVSRDEARRLVQLLEATIARADGASPAGVGPDDASHVRPASRADSGPTDTSEAGRAGLGSSAEVARPSEPNSRGADRAPAALPSRPPEVDAPARPAERAPRRAPQPRSGERPIWATSASTTASKGVGSDALAAIRSELGDCQRCHLSGRRTNIVFGVGNPNARLMFIGEAPGADEDRQAEPFVGAAGQLLTKMIGAMGLRREDVYIANVLKCRPPGNRDPQPDEVATCRPFLDRQIEAIAPEVIVTLGRIAPTALLDREVRITKERGKWTDYRGVPLMMTLHPAFLLRQPEAKRDAWSDLQLVMQRLGLGAPRRGGRDD